MVYIWWALGALGLACVIGPIVGHVIRRMGEPDDLSEVFGDWPHIGGIE